MTIPAVPYNLLQAIARMEGYYVEPGEPGYPTRPQRNLNPGDLEWRKWMEVFGSYKGDPRFAIFPTEASGFAALKHLLGFPTYKGKTIAQIVPFYTKTDIKQYLLNLCAWTEKEPDTIIDGILG